jgi:hypothetical protein
MDKERLIIINGYPNTLKKVEIIEKQLSYLKKLGYSILFISGCKTPSSILDQVDYFILNTNNEPLGKDFTYNLFQLNHWEASHVFVDFNNYSASFYSDVPNNIITENIKLGFNLAKILGYKSVFYTEDDNIWKEESFDYINENINVLKSNQYKLATVLGIQLPADYFIFFTTFFFANVEFMFNNFTLPNSKEEWYDFIKNNQFEFDEFLKVKGVMYNLTFLNSKYDNFFSFLISDMRDKKLKELGI